MVRVSLVIFDDKDFHGLATPKALSRPAAGFLPILLAS